MTSTDQDASGTRFQDFVGVTDSDAANMVELGAAVQGQAETIVDAFYDYMERFPNLTGIMRAAGSNMNRLKAAQRRYLADMFSGDYGPAYVEGRRAIGRKHSEIGLTPRWYLGMYEVYRKQLGTLVTEQFPDQERAAEVMTSIEKVLSMDAQIAVETYHEAQVSIITEAAERARSLAAEMASSVDLVQRITTDQNSGATQQSSAVAETATALEEMKATSDQTLSRADTLGKLAAQVADDGQQGLSSIESVASGMNQIREAMDGIAQTTLTLSEQTQQIGNITSAVAEIAQQSKMLALNASIEAAKAGEAGRGFGVVAAEVRELAGQSQEATQKVQRILEDIKHATDRAVMATESGTKGVLSGLDQVKSAREVMESLTQVIDESYDSSRQIVAAVQQEAQGISQAAQAVSEISEVTNQFAESTNDTRQASENLSSLASRLLEAFEAYRGDAIPHQNGPQER